MPRCGSLSACDDVGLIFKLCARELRALIATGCDLLENLSRVRVFRPNVIEDVASAMGVKRRNSKLPLYRIHMRIDFRELLRPVQFSTKSRSC